MARQQELVAKEEVVIPPTGGWEQTWRRRKGFTSEAPPRNVLGASASVAETGLDTACSSLQRTVPASQEPGPCVITDHTDQDLRLPGRRGCVHIPVCALPEGGPCQTSQPECFCEAAGVAVRHRRPCCRTFASIAGAELALAGSALIVLIVVRASPSCAQSPGWLGSWRE